MEAPRNWGSIDPKTIEGFDQLGVREQKALTTALSGLNDWDKNKLPPRPMIVKITNANPFNFRGFANALHTLGVGISELTRTESGAFTFQPTPYEKSTIPRTPLDELRKRVDTEIANIPPEYKSLFDPTKE